MQIRGVDKCVIVGVGGWVVKCIYAVIQLPPLSIYTLADA